MLLLHPSSTCDRCSEPYNLKDQDQADDSLSEKRPCALPCGHVFCEQCLHSESLEQSCPACATPFDVEHDIHPLSGVSISQDSEKSFGQHDIGRLRSRLLSFVDDTKREIETLLPGENVQDNERNMPRSSGGRSRRTRNPPTSYRPRSPSYRGGSYYRDRDRRARREPTPPNRKLPARSPAPFRRTYSPPTSRSRSPSYRYHSRSRSPPPPRSRARGMQVEEGYRRERRETAQTTSTLPAITIMPLGPGRLHTQPEPDEEELSAD